MEELEKARHGPALRGCKEASEPSRIASHRQCRRRARWLAGLLLPFAFSQASEPAGEAGAKARLEAVQQRIEQVERSMAQGREGRLGVRDELAAVEATLARIARDQRRIVTARRALDRRIVELRALESKQRQTLRRRRSELGAAVRLAFSIGHQDTLKLVLNGERAADVPRLLRYHEFMSRQQRERIAAVRASLAQVTRTGDELAERYRRLEELEREQAEAAATRERERTQRREVLARIDAELGSADVTLARLRRDRDGLNTLLKRLRSALADIPLGTDPPRPFRRLRGALPWPVKGKQVERFGTPRGDSGVRWQGVVLAAPHGEEVRAIANGRVVYASELRGFGNVIILDHGDGYLSLYGHTQTPLREPGEWVNPGDVIAEVGDSGGARRSALYFEVRHQGRPQDPNRWCT